MIIIDILLCLKICLGIRRYIKINLFEILWFFFFLAILFSMIINDSVYITTILRWSVLLLLMFFLKGKEKDYSRDVPVTYADTTALEEDFGFRPSTSLREGLRKFAEWYREFYI